MASSLDKPNNTAAALLTVIAFFVWNALLLQSFPTTSWAVSLYEINNLALFVIFWSFAEVSPAACLLSLLLFVLPPTLCYPPARLFFLWRASKSPLLAGGVKRSWQAVRSPAHKWAMLLSISVCGIFLLTLDANCCRFDGDGLVALVTRFFLPHVAIIHEPLWCVFSSILSVSFALFCYGVFYLLLRLLLPSQRSQQRL